MRFILSSVVVLAFSVTTVAGQDLANGKWKVYDKDYPKAPSKDAVVVEATKSFAQGDCKAILAKGGPEGTFIWAHVHGRHPDRFSATEYKGVIFVKDKGGYYWAVTPILHMDVKGVPTKPTRDLHAVGQFDPDGDGVKGLKEAVESKAELVVEIAISRTRDDIKEITKELEEMMKGPAKDALLVYLGINEPTKLAAAAAELLKKLNEGKKPGGK